MPVPTISILGPLIAPPYPTAEHAFPRRLTHASGVVSVTAKISVAVLPVCELVQLTDKPTARYPQLLKVMLTPHLVFTGPVLLGGACDVGRGADEAGTG